jgi:DNA replication protein DnaD
MISQKRDSKKTLINVVNYGFYQGQEDTKGTAKEHSRNTQGTLKGHSRKQTRMRNNEEYIRKNEKEYSVPSLVENDDSDEEEGWGYD